MNNATRVIGPALDNFLRSVHVQKVYFAEDTVAPPLLAYLTHFPRISLVLEGSHPMELADRGRSRIVQLTRGQAVFVPPNSWNRPEWTSPVTLLTILFGKKQIGMSLVRHDGKAADPTDAVKTNIHGVHEGLTHSLLSALSIFAADNPKPPLDSLLVESLLHSCRRLLESPTGNKSRKGVRTHEAICLYIQENFQSAITREQVAATFGLAPNHISRLFRQEGYMRFNDYVNLVRVSRAKFMLRKYGLPLKEIAASCGYSDTAYFCRIFKKVTKLTPTDYRQQVEPPTEPRP